jgi:hypothetical protein
MTKTKVKNSIASSSAILQKTTLSSSSSSSSSKAKTATASSTARRSFRVSKRDPIVAPGFGTLSDLKALASELDLPVEAVKAIMSSNGRGITRRSRKEKETVTTEPVLLNSAWADFISSEQTPLSGNTTATTNTTTTTTTEMPSFCVDSKLSSILLNEERKYRFPWTTQIVDTRPTKKSKRTVESGGLLLQTGSLDPPCIGRIRMTNANLRIFDLNVPTILLPRLIVRRVIASCSSAHALAIDTHGTVYGWGRNEASQLGSGLPINVARPFALEGLSTYPEIMDGAVGKSHSIVLTSSRELLAVGSNKSGQCAASSSLETIKEFRKCNGASNIVKVCTNHRLVRRVDKTNQIESNQFF